MKRNQRSYLRIAALIFVISILLLDIIHILLPNREYSEMENRNLETKPIFSWDAVYSRRYEKQYESYIEDQFPFRTAWIRCKTTADRILGKRESNGIFLGEDGYLIQNFKEPEQDNLDAMLSAMRWFFKKHPDLQQYMLIAPTAVSILSDKLPSHAPVGDEIAFLNRMKQECSSIGIEFVDIYASLEEAAQSEQVYYRTDHHWTTFGAYTAYLTFAKEAGLHGAKTEYQRLQVSDSFSGTLTASSGLRMSETDDLYVFLPKQSTCHYVVSYLKEQKKSASFYCSDNLKVRDQYTVFLNGNHPLVKIQTDAQSNRTLLVLKDSYANCFVPFLAGDYTEIILVDPRYYADDLELLLKSEYVTDVLYLYNADTLAADSDLKTVIAS